MGRRKRVRPNPVGDSERFYQSTSKIGQTVGDTKKGRAQKLSLRSDDGRKGTLPTVSKYPDLIDIYAMINSLTKAQIESYAKPATYDVLSRDLLFGFAEDWGELNRDHAGYLSQVPEGYDSFTAAIVGDLLYWMITGVNERSKLKAGSELRDAEPWPQEIKNQCPDFSKRLSTTRGLTIHDLRGLQLRILNNLPINSYNRYTMAQMTQDDPELAEQIYPNIDPLTADEHQTVITLRTLVESGNIEKFSVALSQTAGQKFGSTTGTMTFEAFEMAKQAIDAYNRGEIEQTRMRLEALQNEYGMNLTAFQSGLKDMFVLTASSIHLTQQGQNAKFSVKGSTAPLLVSLDTSMPPKGGWKRSDMHAAMKAANQTNIKLIASNDKKISIQALPVNEKKEGTLGLTPVQVTNPDLTIMTTNWTGIFEAAISGRDLTNPNEVEKLRTKVELDWPDEESIAIRFVIHANLAEGIGDDYLVPKGLLTVVARQSNDNETWKAGSFKLGKRATKPNLYLPEIDIFVQDLGRAGDLADAITLQSIDSKLDKEIVFGEGLQELSVSTARRGAKRSGHSAGITKKAIAIDLVPRTQINVRSITEKPKTQGLDFAYLKKIRDEEKLQELYKHYATGQEPKKTKGGYRWRGKVYPSKKQAAEAVGKKGTQVDKGNPKMQILYAKRKDNGNLVPHRLILPRIMVRHDLDSGRLSANKSSKHSAATKRLLKRLEKDFGPLIFKKGLSDAGGYDIVKKAGGKTLNYNRGVGKIFSTTGLNYEGTKLYVTQVALNGAMHYSGRLPGGGRIGPMKMGAKA